MIAAFVVTKNGVDNAAILDIMYYIIITPLVTIALTKIAYSGEAEMTLIDALKRADKIMEIDPLTEGNTGSKPADHIVVLKDGVVAEQGSPEYLSGYDSKYSRMTAQQLISQSWTM